MTRLRVPAPFSPKFVAYQFLFLWRENYLRQKSTQHVSQASINSQTLTETIPLLLAPKQEQDAIVVELERRFDRLRSVEHATDMARTRLRDYEEFIVQAAIEGTLTPAPSDAGPEAASDSASVLLAGLRQAWGPQAKPEHKTTRQSGMPLFADDAAVRSVPADLPAATLEPLPEGWVWARVSEVGRVTLGRQRSPQHHAGTHMRPYLRVANVFEDRFDFSNVLEMNFTPAEFETYALQHGDILLNEGQSPELVGRPAMFRGEMEGLCFQNTLIRFRAYPGVSPGFALLVFRAYLHNGRFRSIAKWTTNIAHLGAQRFAQLEFPLPPLVEQERIVAEAARRHDIAETLRATLSSILAQIDGARDLALAQAFTGTLVPPISGDVSALTMLEQIRELRSTQNEPKPKAPRGGSMNRAASQRRKARVPLRQLLEEASEPLSPEELFAASGIGEDLIDEFFAELKAEHQAGRVQQSFDAQGHVALTLLERVR
ncbi:hypothetical protein QLH51_17210 [Sphingomonas sp. 2R-10]|uniref:restriction endonuclease subunit S n=1 Tax=Sphingomonas sp. 2R-10 TaxID=3045148 RepID=UPI000F79D024|nr:hypothetical protein [Sphingomonas sp. 2R-10]MDJ0278538.1 hypothetical protein [Sphingomonas sp. 2R-10]